MWCWRAITQVFAMGQVYVLFSRVTDPRHLQLVGHSVDRIKRSNAHRNMRYIPQAYLLGTFLQTWLVLGELLGSMWPNAVGKRRR